ncbi:hypothetical protein ACSMXN_05235 [Jatrophihabitans sp. DSM 45814]
MTLQIFGADEAWPTESLPSHFRKPMQQAQAAGWSLHYQGADHWYGTLVCPAGESDPHVHTFKIDKTARGSGFFAAEASKKVTRNCRHGESGDGSKVKDRDAECAQLLDAAERLLDKVETGLDQAEAHQAAGRTLDQIEAQLDAADATVEQALSDVYETQDAPSPDDLSDELDAAEASAVEANCTALRLSRGRPRLAKPHQERARLCRERVAALRSRLDPLLPK